ncbi:MAG: serine/threonine protein kinase, partial [Archangium sp.]|nr:serine/threonine protein kinase [Archangium sp.]
GVAKLLERSGPVGVPANPHIKEIGGFPVLRELGRGGMGTVYLATNPQGQQVVIKVPFTEFSDPQYAEIFFREFQAASTVRHDNIVRVFRYGRDTTHNVYYFVAELVDGVTVKDYCEGFPDRPFTASEAATVSLAIVRAIRFLRSRDITHRDLKPGNVMFDREGWVKLIDFGAAKIGGQHSELTNSGVMMGTFDYMAPEAGQKGAEASVGAERDIYALGIIHYRLMKGRLPTAFGAGNAAAVAFARFSDARSRPLTDLSGIDALSKRLLLDVTHRDVKRRLVDFDEIERRLLEICKVEGERMMRAEQTS